MPLFWKMFDVLPQIIHAFDLSAQNTDECYRRMLKNNFLYQSCNKICEKTDNAYAILRNMEYIQIQEYIVDHEQQIQ